MSVALVGNERCAYRVSRVQSSHQSRSCGAPLRARQHAAAGPARKACPTTTPGVTHFAPTLTSPPSRKEGTIVHCLCFQMPAFKCPCKCLFKYSFKCQFKCPCKCQFKYPFKCLFKYLLNVIFNAGLNARWPIWPRFIRPLPVGRSPSVPICQNVNISTRTAPGLSGPMFSNDVKSIAKHAADQLHHARI